MALCLAMFTTRITTATSARTPAAREQRRLHSIANVCLQTFFLREALDQDDPELFARVVEAARGPQQNVVPIGGTWVEMVTI